MSLFPYILLPKGLPDETAALSHGTPPNPDDARNINAEPEERTVQATLSQVNGPGEVEFVRNVPMRVCSGVRLPLKAPPDAPNPEQFRLYGITAEPRDEADFQTVKEYALVAAAWPWSRRWHDYGYFKPPADKGAERTSRVWQEALRYRGGWREYLREKATVNLFSQQRGLWKAVLFDPNLADENVAPGREYSLPRPKIGKKQPDIVPSIYWGLCRDLSECARVLTSKEHTPQLDELKVATIEGFLFKKYHAGHPKLDPRANPWRNPKTGEYEFHESHAIVHESLRNTDRAEQFMNHAIRVALAGPEDLDEFPHYPGRDGRPCRLVATQVQRIYLELVFNAHKRAVQGQYSSKSRPSGQPQSEPKATEVDPEVALNSAVEERVKFYGQQSDKARKRALAEAMQTLEFPAPVEWTATDDETVDPDSQTAGTDAPALSEACLQIVALARLGVTDARTPMYLKEVLEDAEPQVRLVVEYALAQLKASRKT